jgi:hypothetical protein
MSTKKTLDDRRRALENAFFEKENAKLLERLRTEKERAAQRQALFDVTKLSDETVLDHLIDAGIRAETWLAISLVPLVEVAWADRVVHDEQRNAILKAAEAHGVTEGSHARQLLEDWLTYPPAPIVREAWSEYVEALHSILSGSAIEAMREETLEMSRAIAEASGGILGLGHAIKDSEAKVLEELGRAF